MMIRQEIAKITEKVIKDLQKEGFFPKIDIPKIQVEHPEEKAHGDYATNVAMVIAKQVKKNPLEIAENLKSQISNLKLELFEKVEVKVPGFINFFLSKEYLRKQVEEILEKGDKFGQLSLGKNQKVNIEFISANPTGPLHIGNGRGAFFGDTLTNILERTGYKVTREYFINDAPVSGQIRALGRTYLEKGETYLTPYIEEKRAKSPNRTKFIQKLKIAGGEGDDILYGQAGHVFANEIQADIRDFIENKLNIKFDNWVRESDFYQPDKKANGKSLITKTRQFLDKKNLTEKKDSAIWIKTKEYGDSQNWVIVKSNNEATYLLSDIAYHENKINRKFDKIINIWGADHQGHVGKIKAVAKMLGYKGDLDILISQVVRLKKGKISKRTGEIVTLEWLIDEVGLDAARFFYLMKSLDTQMEFDVALAKEKSEKSPVYYCQYAHARIASILRKYEVGSTKTQILKSSELQTSDFRFLSHPSELELIKQLIRFSEIVEDTAKDYQVQRLPQYAIDLATSFHQFYRDCRVISDNKELTQARLALVLTTKTVLKNTLNLMGVSVPERM